MSLKQVSPFLRAWHKWKTLPLPWRRQVLVGLDLNGNTYWEFRDNRGAETGRKRRIVKCPPKTHHGDVVISPAWHQWLRHTRVVAPTLDEQRAELVRQSRIKVLAAEADARWAAKPSLTDAPKNAEAVSPPGGNGDAAEEPGDAGKHSAKPPAPEHRSGVNGSGQTDATGDRKETWRKLQEDEKARGASEPNDPWKRARGGPSEGWQPKGWDPSATSRR